MCGYGMHTIFQFAIFVICVVVVLAIINRAFGNIFSQIQANPFWWIIQLVISGVVAIVVLMILWRLAECAGLMHGSLALPLYG